MDTRFFTPAGKPLPPRKRCCGPCGRLLHLSKFKLSTAGYYGTRCQPCCSILQAAWAKRHPRKFKKVQRRYLAKLKQLGVRRISDLEKQPLKKKKKRGIDPVANEIAVH